MIAIDAAKCHETNRRSLDSVRSLKMTDVGGDSRIGRAKGC
jgi:hypothetical protein